MKHTVLAIVVVILFGLAAWAQAPGSPTTQTPDPSTSTQSQTSPSQSPDMSTQGSDQSKGEKKLKGCIASEGGKFVLQGKHGKDVTLGGSQDLASHVGHTVTVHGSYAGAGDSAAASGSTSGMSSTGEQFIVTKIEMVSDTCKEGKGKDQSDSKPSPNVK